MARPPARLNDFIGQARVVARLRRLVAGARQRGEAVGPILLLGRAGMGKTALAGAIAREYAGTSSSSTQPANFVRILAGPRMTKTLVDTLSAAKFGDFIFNDEIHSYDREAQELLQIAIDERRTRTRTEDGKVDRNQPLISIADVTLLGATTEPGKLTVALRSRFNQITLDPYTQLELRAIAQKAGTERGLNLTPLAARQFAECSQKTPRSIENLLSKFRAVTKSADVDRQAARVFFQEEGINERGLDPSQQEYVRILAAANGRRTSLAILGARLGLDAKYIREDIESFLTLLALVEIGSGGRMLTAQGRAVAEEMARARRDGDPDASDSEPDEEEP
jgi:Holliday junction DNA helicase RuvB